MPLHMLPPSLLQRVCLSETEPNECLTAIISFDVYGKIRSYHHLITT